MLPDLQIACFTFEGTYLMFIRPLLFDMNNLLRDSNRLLREFAPPE